MTDQGFGIDLQTSFPAILSGIVEEISKESHTEIDIKEVRRMIRGAKQWRTEIAVEMGTAIATIKRGVNAILFGMDLKAWKRRSGISDDKRSQRLERLEKEVKEARVLIVRKEREKNPMLHRVKPTTILSRAVERVEAQIMEELSSRLAEKRWKTTTMIHDEIIVTKSGHHTDSATEGRNIQEFTKACLREFEAHKGWREGTLHANISSL